MNKTGFREFIATTYVFVITFCLVLLSGCVSNPSANVDLSKMQGRVPAEKLLVVDCLLPPQIRKLGAHSVYATARRPIKTTALDCEIRGGEYVAYDRADYRTALNAWLPMAQQGDPEAQTYVGEIYEKGLGLPADYKAAFHWYMKAAEQGFSRAQINLGYLYEKGLGVKADPVQALNWYRRASGISDDIAYESEIDVKAEAIATRLTDDLKRKIAQQDRQIKQLKRSLASAKRDLEQRKRALKDSLGRLHELELKLRQPDASNDSLRRAYEHQKRLVAQQRQQVAALKQQVAQKQEILAKPSIEILEPPILATRSGGLPTLQVRSGSGAQIIRGRILANSGIRRASLNGRLIPVDSNGLFNAAIPVPTEEVEIVVRAIDNGGQSGEFSFRLVPEKTAEVASRPLERVGRIAHSIDFGRYYAVVIGNNEYRNFPALKTAVNDARAVAEVLRNRYGVETRLITNADRYTILSALNEVKNKLKENDNLLIYYAGHGEIDPATKQGYWLPVDADKNNTANWISNSAITDLLNTIEAKHIMVVADSCYSGSMSRTSIPRLNVRLNDARLQKWLKLMTKTRSRTVLTSGGLQPVLDTGGGAHSIFAQAFLEELKRGNGVIDGYRVYLDVSRAVEAQAATVGFDQVPTYAPIQHAGHGGGEFLLVSSG